MKKCPRLNFSIDAIFLSFFSAVEVQAQVQEQHLKEITITIGMKLVLIPRGTFTTGSWTAETDPDRVGGKNYARHDVTISTDYYLGVYEVTQAHYSMVMGRNPGWFQRDRVNGDSSNHPVDQVSWKDAVEFCNRMSKLPEEMKAGRVYRLPTEAEWEHASRAGSNTKFFFGKSSSLLCDYAWYGGIDTVVGDVRPLDVPGSP